MTSSDDQRPNDDGSLIGARFFKIILQATVRDKKLLIPSKFVKNCGEGLLDSAILNVPSGLSWTVDVVRDEIGVWFRNGWQDFAEFHSLGYGHFLVFEYKGGSSFYVVICDRTATEIVYPIARPASNQQPADEAGKLLLEPKVEVIEDDSDAVDERNKGKSPMEVSKSRGKTKKKMVRRGRSSTRNGKVEVESCNEQSAAGHHSAAQGLGSNSAELGLVEEEGTDDKKIHEVLPFARGRKPITAFTSPHPFFDCRVTSSTLSRSQMYVPRSFSVRNIGQDEKSVTLQVADTTWPVTVARDRSDRYVSFADGWHGFREDNSLEVGDICIFECIQGWTNVLLKVTIIRKG